MIGNDINTNNLNNLPIEAQANIISYLPKNSLSILSTSSDWAGKVRHYCLNKDRYLMNIFASNILRNYLSRGGEIPSPLLEAMNNKAISSLDLTKGPISRNHVNNRAGFFKIIAPLQGILKKINFASWGLRDADIQSLQQFRLLEELDLSRNEKIKNFYNVPNHLKVLNLDSCHLDSTALSKILQDCSNLTDLNISNADVDDRQSRNLPILTEELLNLLPESLEILKCQRRKLTDELLLTILKRCPNLIELDISGNRGIAASTFEFFPLSLRVLKCQDNRLDDNHLMQLKRLSNLKNLDISATSRELQESALSSLPSSLEVLQLVGSSSSLNDRHLEGLSHLSNLKELNIEGNRHIKGSTFKFFPQTLEKLCFDGCSIEEIFFMALKDFQNLDKISFKENEELKSGGIFEYIREKEGKEITSSFELRKIYLEMEEPLLESLQSQMSQMNLASIK